MRSLTYFFLRSVSRAGREMAPDALVTHKLGMAGPSSGFAPDPDRSVTRV